MVSSKPISLKTIVTLSLSALLLSLPATVSGRDIPANLKSFYNTVKTKGCSKPFKSGFGDGQGNSGFAYCADYKDHGLIYLTGPKELADMDVDCDGANNKGGKCSNDPSGQSQTAFQDIVKTYGIKDLNANIHPYVVFGNEDSSPSFKPQSVGMKPLSVMAVVCNNNLFYGIWGDTNGGTDTGEAAISLATACFPNEDISGDSGHTQHDVLYLGFLNASSVPGKDGAKWDAKSFEEFEQSIAKLGDSLVAIVPSK
ncbi:hypothetical protein VTN96DRAFT_8682 [Rasamsonia emersonii]|uniref:Endo-chitosanase n=1 Tax=Rasamsonia emersonii (strain ATCC 16479 / CBS 393.64 / IMI 116815) TaxID=1408163 RepID=A0A0F4YJY3_RASE3|nr:chitosanase [Rasamsonia emersonii CBS 393.64]KKA18539.1 chitosanase [Rasamsonia emersonii CBS 393.64]